MHRTVAVLAAIVLTAAPALAKTEQGRSDKVVGYWKSSNGTSLNLAYSGSPKTVWVQVYQPRGGQIDYVASWTSNTTFAYKIDGETVVGTYNPKSDTISARTTTGNWSATWRRRR